MKKFRLLLLCLFLGTSIRAQISDSLYRALPDTVKPVDKNRLTNNEISRVLSNNIRILGPDRMAAELDALAARLDKDSRQLPAKEMLPLRKAVAFYLAGRTKDYDSTLRYIGEVTDLAIKEGNNSDAVDLYTLSGNVYTIRLKRYEDAISMLTNALNVSLKSGGPARISMIYAQLTSLYATMAMVDEALASNEQFLKYARAGGIDYAYKGMYYFVRIQLLQMQYDKGYQSYQDSADRTIEEAFRELRPQAAEWYEVLFLFKAVSRYNLKQYPQALAYLDSANRPEYRNELHTAALLPMKELYRG